MKEQENKNSEETSKETSKDKAGVPLRTYLIMILAGAYVAYLGVSLCQNVIKGAEGSSPVFLVIGVIFIILGIVFVINGIRGSLRVSKEQKAQAAENERAAADITEENSEEEVSGESVKTPEKKMSIADRANLVNRLGDDADKED